MPNHVILHVGQHKTGTTALQTTFCEQRARLAEAGILYPETACELGHHGLPAAIRESDRSVLRALCDEIGTANRVLLSSEQISCLRREQLESLRRLFPGAQFEVIVVLRRLPELWPSHWRELVKHGLPHPFDHYLAELHAVKPVELSSPLRPTRLLSDCVAVFGRDALKVMCFEAHPRGRSYGVSFVRKALGLENAEAFATATVNQMPADWKIELARIFNAYGIGWVNHIGRKAILNALIGKLALEEPKWVPEFRDHLDAAEATVLTDRAPLVAEEVARVIDLFGDRFVDPIDVADGAARTEVRCIDPATLPEPLETEMKKEFRQFRLRLTGVRTPEEREAELAEASADFV